MSHYPTTQTNSSENDLGSPSNDAPVLKVGAAVILSRNGEVFTLPPPNRHYDIGLLMAALRQPRPKASAMGFLLTNGKWCNRRDAMKIAIAARQVSSLRYKETELTTNYLW